MTTTAFFTLLHPRHRILERFPQVGKMKEADLNEVKWHQAQFFFGIQPNVFSILGQKKHLLTKHEELRCIKVGYYVRRGMTA